MDPLASSEAPPYEVLARNKVEQVVRMLSNVSTVRARALDDKKQLEEMRNTCREQGRASQPLAACDS